MIIIIIFCFMFVRASAQGLDGYAVRNLTIYLGGSYGDELIEVLEQYIGGILTLLVNRYI